jgi:hypothetical protein
MEAHRIKLLKFVHTFDIGGTERQVVTGPSPATSIRPVSI